MVDCKPISTPLKAKTKNISNTSLSEDPSFFHELIGALQYLILTRLNLSCNVNFVSPYMHPLTVTHLKMVGCILQYIKGTINIGLHFTYNTTLDFYAFSNAE